MEITKLHEDIIQTHILTRLDGRSLTAAGCTSSHLQSLCSDHKLWSNICHSTWPSTLDPLVNKAISTFTSGHRSFFSDAFSSPSDHLITAASPPPPTTQLISTVDLKYNNQLLFSKVVSTNTTPSHDFSSYIFRVDAMGQKEVVRSESIKLPGDDRVMELDLMKHMSLSWVVIDPSMNRAVNLSSLNPVSVTRNWFTDEYELVFAVVTAVDDDEYEYEYVNCNIEITCGVKDGSLELYVSGVSLTVQDVDGRCLNGKDSMVILHGLMAAERRRCDGGERRKERYHEYIERRKERKEMVERRERRLDLVRVGCGVAFMMAFWSFALL